MLREITNFVRILPPNNMRRILLLICLFVILVTPAVAQLYQYLDTQNGLSSRRVLSIRKDKKGYMWFLTHEGIDRYNGKQYTHYSLTANGKLLNFFPNLNTLQTDTAGVVWEIGKTGHLFRYNSLQDKFELVCDFASKDKSNSGLPLTASFLDSKDNNILLCTKNKQYLFDIDTHELIQLESPIKEEITYIAKSTNNQYFLASSHKIYCAKLNHGRLETIKHPELDNFHIVNYIYFHPETQMLVIGTLLDGIYLYNIHSRQLIDVHNGLQDINVNSIIASKENENEVLIATNGAGVYKLNLGTYELTNFLNADHNHSNKMNGNIINDIYIDDDQKLWMAVYPIGITVYSEKYPGYKWIQHSYDNPNSLIDNQVNYILEDSEGDIWYATNNGVCCYRPSTKQWTNLLSTYQHDTPNQNHVFISICESRPGIILGGLDGGNGLGAAHLKMDHIVGENHQPAQGDGRQMHHIAGDLDLYFFRHSYSPIACRTGVLFAFAASSGGSRIRAALCAISACIRSWGEHSPSSVVMSGLPSSTSMSMLPVRKNVMYGANFSVTVSSPERCSPFL